MKKILAIAVVVGAAFWVLPTDAEAGGFRFPVHGNWCGPGHGGGDPVDALDEACKRHDECYKKEDHCGCDEVLIDEISGLQVFPLAPGGEVALVEIRFWFKNKARVCAIDDLISDPVPEPKDILKKMIRGFCGILC